MTHELVRLLEEMGASADAVAALLRVEGIRARRLSYVYANPVVQFLSRRHALGKRAEIPVGSSSLFLDATGTPERVSLPDAVREFLERFHQGEFPELEVR